MFSGRGRSSNNRIGGGGGSKPDLPFSHPLLTFYRVFKITIPRKQKFPRREPKLFRRCGDRLGV